MNKPQSKHAALSLAPLLLFVIFTACILAVLLTGADLYRSLAQRDQDQFHQRTIAQYLTTRIRQNDVDRMIFVGDFQEEPSLMTTSSTGDTLFLREEISGRVYYTRVYCHDGALRELFSPAGLEFFPSDGTAILAMNDLTFSLQGDLLSIQIQYEDDTAETLLLHLRSGEEVAP